VTPVRRETTIARAMIAETAPARTAPAGRTIVGRMIAGRTHKSLSLVLSTLVLGGILAWSSPVTTFDVSSYRTPLSRSERCLRRVPEHITEFTPVSEPLALPRCGSVRPPEALLTPDPLLPAEDENLSVRISFIVGSDGRVHSAFVLHGAGNGEDEVVLRAVRQWRYRPALCNGVPTDSEARVRFSIR
jgi:TonB family protein